MQISKGIDLALFERFRYRILANRQEVGSSDLRGSYWQGPARREITPEAERGRSVVAASGMA
jgi:hypothetical protein